MSKVITFSRYFPKGHRNEGKETFFIEKIWENSFVKPQNIDKLKVELLNSQRHEYQPKIHTIRAGNRWKVGDKFSPRVWTAKPYTSPQIQFVEDLEIVKIYEIEINFAYERFWIDNAEVFNIEIINKIAANDGLSFDDFENWFGKKLFKGQILCWSNVVY